MNNDEQYKNLDRTGGHNPLIPKTSFRTETYEEQYERLKGTGGHPAVLFMSRPLEKEEVYVPVDLSWIEPDRYRISNFGNVYDTVKDEPVKFKSDSESYKTCSLKCKAGGSDAIRLNRLMLMVFDENPDYANLQANHIDGDPSNNRLSNLEWTTPKENTDHAMLYELHSMSGALNPNSKLTEKEVREICELIQTGKYFDTEIAKMYNVTYTNISDIHKGKLWTHISKDYDLSNRKPRKFTEQEAREICELLQEGKLFDTQIAKMYNTTHETVGMIKNGKLWKHISKDYVFKEKARKFTKDQVREICEVMQKGEYLDGEIAKMFGTTSTFLKNLRDGVCHRDVTKDYDMTIRKYNSPKTQAKYSKKSSEQQ